MTSDSQIATRKKRLFYLDFIRVLSVFIIILTHFINPYLASSGLRLINVPFGIYIGSLGVSLFLMISGTALTITYRRPLSLRRFYKKRFLSIYPMFWMAWLLGTLLTFLMYGWWINRGPAWSFLLTFSAMDGLARALGAPTMYLLGEWFLGFIVLFYAIFPLLLWGVQKHPYITAVVVFVIYGISFATVSVVKPSWEIMVLLPLRLPELAFGIYFATYVRRLRGWILVPTVVVLAVSEAFPDEIPEAVAVPLVGISVFLILAYLAKFLDWDFIRVPTQVLSKYSYAVFLVHHQVILAEFYFLPTKTMSHAELAIMFLAACVVSYLLGVMLYWMHQKFMEMVHEALKKTEKPKGKYILNPQACRGEH